MPAALLVDGRSLLRSCRVSETLPFHSPTKLARKLLPVTCIVTGQTEAWWLHPTHAWGRQTMDGGKLGTLHNHKVGMCGLQAIIAPCTGAEQALVS